MCKHNSSTSEQGAMNTATNLTVA